MSLGISIQGGRDSGAAKHFSKLSASVRTASDTHVEEEGAEVPRALGLAVHPAHWAARGGFCPCPVPLDPVAGLTALRGSGTDSAAQLLPVHHLGLLLPMLLH